MNDHESLKSEQDAYKPLPIIRQVDTGMVHRNYMQIKQDVEGFVASEIERMMDNPELKVLVIKK